MTKHRTPPPEPAEGTVTPDRAAHHIRPVNTVHPQTRNHDTGPGAVGNRSGSFLSDLESYAHRNRKGR